MFKDVIVYDDGLSGLNRLNVVNAENLDGMFSGTITKQSTLNSLNKWRFSKENISINNLFSSSGDYLNFKDALSGWATKEKTPFCYKCDEKNVFGSSYQGTDKVPEWFANAKKT